MNAQTKIAASPAVYTAIAAVQGELAKVGIAKNRKNSQGSGYNFRGIDDVYSALSPLLATHGLCVLPRVIEHNVIERASKSGGALFYTVVKVEFDFVAVADGSTHTCATYGEAMDSGDKSTNKAMSAAYKYAAFMAFAIPVEGEPDADASTHEVAPKTEPAPREKLEGRYASKSVLQAALREFAGKLQAADTIETIDALETEYADAITQCKRDLPIWWKGDGTPEKRGFEANIADARATLSAADEGMFGELIRSMKQCETMRNFTSWSATNEVLIDGLNDIERRRFERERDAFESGLTVEARRNAG